VTWYNPIASWDSYTFTVQAQNDITSYSAGWSLFVAPIYSVYFTVNVSTYEDYKTPLYVSGYIDASGYVSVNNRPVRYL
jgi:hypothetical protein